MSLPKIIWSTGEWLCVGDPFVGDIVCYWIGGWNSLRGTIFLCSPVDQMIFGKLIYIRGSKKYMHNKGHIVELYALISPLYYWFNCFFYLHEYCFHEYMNKNGPVIVIEDDPDDQELFEDIFKELNCPNPVLFFLMVLRHLII